MEEGCEHSNGKDRFLLNDVTFSKKNIKGGGGALFALYCIVTVSVIV